MSNYKTLSTFFNKDCSLTRLVNAITEAIDFNYVLDGFYDNFFNIDTASDYWLDVWGRIVGLDRAVKLLDNNCFGFAGSGGKTFNEAPFFSGSPLSNSFTIANTELYRHAIKTKQLINISDCSIPSLNAVVSYFFDDNGASFVVDNYDMSITYWLAIAETDDKAIIFTSPVFCPRPAGVKVKFKFNQTFSPANYDFFGFDGTRYKTFNQAPFYDETLGYE